jgi:hypothetical protein
VPISHANRFVFIHLPRTAGSSVIEALRLHCGNELDFNERNVLPRFLQHPRGAELLRDLRRFYELNTLANFPDQHLPARILREFVEPQLWSSYFKFAFVRNPWDLIASSYHFLRQSFEKYPATVAGDPDIAYIVLSVDFTNFVRSLPFLRVLGDQLGQITDERGLPLVDFVGRVENLEADWTEICRRTGMDVRLPHVNSAEHKQYREYYTDETREIIAREFARDIKIFDYSF